MTCKQLYEIADKIAPFSISEEYIQKLGHRDNSGIMLDCGEPIKGVVFSLDLSQAAIAAAKKAGANCIFTHHPAIWNGVMKLEEGTGADNLLTCIRERISVLSAHLNLDAAPGGVNDVLADLLGATAGKMCARSRAFAGAASSPSRLPSPSKKAPIRSSLRTGNITSCRRRWRAG